MPSNTTELGRYVRDTNPEFRDTPDAELAELGRYIRSSNPKEFGDVVDDAPAPAMTKQQASSEIDRIITPERKPMVPQLLTGSKLYADLERNAPKRPVIPGTESLGGRLPGQIAAGPADPTNLPQVRAPKPFVPPQYENIPGLASEEEMAHSRELASQRFQKAIDTPPPLEELPEGTVGGSIIGALMPGVGPLVGAAAGLAKTGGQRPIKDVPGIEQGLTRSAANLFTPKNLAVGAALGAGPQVVRAGAEVFFTAEMLNALRNQVPAAYDAYKRGDTDLAKQLATEALFSGGMTALMGSGAAKTIPAAVKDLRGKPVPTIPDVEVLPRRERAVVREQVRNIEVPPVREPSAPPIDDAVGRPRQLPVGKMSLIEVEAELGRVPRQPDIAPPERVRELMARREELNPVEKPPVPSLEEIAEQPPGTTRWEPAEARPQPGPSQTQPLAELPTVQQSIGREAIDRLIGEDTVPGPPPEPAPAGPWMRGAARPLTPELLRGPESPYTRVGGTGEPPVSLQSKLERVPRPPVQRVPLEDMPVQEAFPVRTEAPVAQPLPIEMLPGTAERMGPSVVRQLAREDAIRNAPTAQPEVQPGVPFDPAAERAGRIQRAPVPAEPTVEPGTPIEPAKPFGSERGSLPFGRRRRRRDPINLKRLDVSDDARQIIRDAAVQVKAKMGGSVVTHNEVIDAAVTRLESNLANVIPEYSAAQTAQQGGQRLALRRAVASLGVKAQELETKLADTNLSELERRQATDALGQTQADLMKVIEADVKQASFFGRMLNFYGIMAEAKADPWDARPWVQHLQRSVKEEALPKAVTEGLQKVLDEGRKTTDAVAQEVVARRQRVPKRDVTSEMRIERAVKHRLDVIEGKEKPAKDNPWKLTEEEREAVNSDPRVVAAIEKKNAAITPEMRVEKGVKHRVSTMEGEMKERPDNPWKLTENERAVVNNDPRVLAAKQKLSRFMAEQESMGFWQTFSYLARGSFMTVTGGPLRDLVGTSANVVVGELARMPGAVMDAITAGGGKQRTVFVPSPREFVAGVKAMRGSLADFKKQVKYGAEPRALDNFPRVAVTRVKGAQSLVDLATYVYRIRAAVDIPPAKAAEYFHTLQLAHRYVAEQAAKGNKLKGAAKEQAIQEFMKNPPIEAQGEILRLTDESVFHNETALYRGWRAMKREWPETAKALVESLFVPFVKAPSSVFVHQLEQTYGIPYALFRHAVQRKMVQTPAERAHVNNLFGKGMVGAGLIVLGYYGAKNGVVTGFAESPELDKQVQEKRAGNKQGGSFLAGGKWFNISNIAPFGTMLTVGASIWDMQKAQRHAGFNSLFEQGLAAVFSGFRSTFNQPYLQGVRDLAEGIGEGFDTNLAQGASKWAGTKVGALIPGIVAATAEGMDPVQRVTTGTTPIETFTRSIANRLPVVRENMPIKRDLFGRAMENAGWTRFLPAPALNDKNDPVINEILKIGLDVPKTQPKNHPGNEDSPPQKEPENERELRMALYGAARYKALQREINSEWYQKLTHNKDRRDRLKKAMQQETQKLTNYLGKSLYAKQPPEWRLQRLMDAQDNLQLLPPEANLKSLKEQYTQ